MNLIAINTNCTNLKTRKICCPNCNGRICDLVINDSNTYSHKYKIVLNSGKSHFAVKCHKCGNVIGVALM